MTIAPEDAYELHRHVTSRRGVVNLPDERGARLAAGPAAAGQGPDHGERCFVTGLLADPAISFVKGF
jgi:hypothetical protein